MELNILAGGPLKYVPDLKKYPGLWIGVDRGVMSLLNLGLEVHKGFGDFDSISTSELVMLKERVQALHMYPAEKDETDTELAVMWALNQFPKRIRLFGATGGRLDHFFANVQLLLKAYHVDKNISIELVDRQNSIQLLGDGQHIVRKEVEYPYISFIPLHGPIESLSLTGFKYPLQNEFIPFDSTRCISNELILDSGTISFLSGILMVIRSRDELPEF